MNCHLKTLDLGVRKTNNTIQQVTLGNDSYETLTFEWAGLLHLGHELGLKSGVQIIFKALVVGSCAQGFWQSCGMSLGLEV